MELLLSVYIPTAPLILFVTCLVLYKYSKKNITNSNFKIIQLIDAYIQNNQLKVNINNKALHELELPLSLKNILVMNNHFLTMLPNLLKCTPAELEILHIQDEFNSIQNTLMLLSKNAHLQNKELSDLYLLNHEFFNENKKFYNAIMSYYPLSPETTASLYKDLINLSDKGNSILIKPTTVSKENSTLTEKTLYLEKFRRNIQTTKDKLINITTHQLNPQRSLDDKIAQLIKLNLQISNLLSLNSNYSKKKLDELDLAICDLHNVEQTLFCKEVLNVREHYFLNQNYKLLVKNQKMIKFLLLKLDSAGPQNSQPKSITTSLQDLISKDSDLRLVDDLKKQSFQEFQTKQATDDISEITLDPLDFKTPTSTPDSSLSIPLEDKSQQLPSQVSIIESSPSKIQTQESFMETPISVMDSLNIHSSGDFLSSPLTLGLFFFSIIGLSITLSKRKFYNFFSNGYSKIKSFF